MQSITDLQNSLSSLNDIINSTINPVFTDLQNASHVFDPVISSHTIMIQKINEMIDFLNSNIVSGGIQGVDGLSAYQVAMLNGYIGTVQEWLLSLEGANGSVGADGLNGFSAYDLATINGYVGTVQDWLTSLKGLDGASSEPSLLAEFIVTGSAVTSIDFSGLDINLHKGYRVEMSLLSGISNTFYYCLINGDNLLTNYRSINFYAQSSAGILQYNYPYCAYSYANQHTFCELAISLFNNSFSSWQGKCITQASTPGLFSMNYSGYKAVSDTNITQLTFVSSVANGFAVGSRIRIYRGDT